MKVEMNWEKVVRYLLCAGLFSLLAACQNTPAITALNKAALSEAELGRVFFSDNSGISAKTRLDNSDPHVLTKEMKVFAHHVAPTSMPPEYRLKQLVQAIMSPSGLDLSYNPYATYTVAESFAKRQANCLSFTMLFVALAAEVGLHAEFNEVDIPPTWDLQDNNRLVYYRHVNALVKLPYGKKKIVDINMGDYNEEYEQRKLSLAQVEALYYNNRGVEAMAAGEGSLAFLNFQRAIVAQRDMAFVWGNLGSLYRRFGFLELAEASYVFALSLGKFDPMVGSNLAKIYRLTGRLLEAGSLDAFVLNARNRNPYYQYALAIIEFERGDVELAISHVNNAIKLNKKDHRFYFLKANIHAKMGFVDQVNDDLRIAMMVSSDMAIKTKYQNKLARIVALNL